jgi:hypothetical protein
MSRRSIVSQNTRSEPVQNRLYIENVVAMLSLFRERRDFLKCFVFGLAVWHKDILNRVLIFF